MDFGFESLQSSLSYEDVLLCPSESFDSFYSTYMDNMNTPGTPEDTYNTGAYSTNQYPTCSSGNGSNFGAETYGKCLPHPPQTSFRQLPIASWRGEECINWASAACKRRGVDSASVNLWGLGNSTGAALLHFTPRDFCATVGDQYGEMLYQEFVSYWKKHNAKAAKSTQLGHPEACTTTSYDLLNPALASGSDPVPCFGSGGFGGDSYWEYTDQDLKDLEQYIPEASSDPLAHSLHDLELQAEQFMPIKCENPHQPLQYPTGPFATSSAVDVTTPQASGSLQGSGGDVFKKIPTNTRRKERGPKSWEFLIRLLADKRTNPALIRWEDETSATFRLTQPAIIAQMWGARADKPNLSYVNFARGLRYHYNTGALEAVSERQLVYKCGPKALEYLSQLRKEAP